MKHKIKVNLTANRLEDEGAEILGDFLKRDKNVELLKVHHVGFSSQGQSRIFESLEFNQTLKSLSIDIYSESELNSLIKYVRGNVSLTKISLLRLENFYNVPELFSVLTSKNIKTLCLNWAKKEIIEHLFPNLSSSNLTYLNLRGLYFGDSGIEKLLQSLGSHTKMRRLHLYCNELTELGGNLILEFLQKNDTLTRIDLLERLEWSEDEELTFNEVGEETHQKILSCLERNNRLQELNGRACIMVLILQRRNDGNIVSRLPRRLLIYLLPFIHPIIE